MMTSFLPDEGTIMHSQRQFNYLWVSPPSSPREEHGHIPLPLSPTPHSSFMKNFLKLPDNLELT